MVRCEDCVHYDVCKFVDEYNPAYCDEYKPTADVVEVVRCKDCVFVRGNEVGCFCGRLNPRMGHHVFDDEFCSFGARKEVE